MFMFQSLKYLPAHILGIEGEIVGIVAFGLGGLFLLLIPFLDRRPRAASRAVSSRGSALPSSPTCSCHVSGLHGQRHKVMLGRDARAERRGIPG